MRCRHRRYSGKKMRKRLRQINGNENPNVPRGVRTLRAVRDGPSGRPCLVRRATYTRRSALETADDRVLIRFRRRGQRYAFDGFNRRRNAGRHVKCAPYSSSPKRNDIFRTGNDTSFSPRVFRRAVWC